MADTGARGGLDQAVVYEIKVQGELDEEWSSWFEDGRRVWSVVMTVEHGITTLTGAVADQPALYGLLGKVRDLGLPLLSVIRLEKDAPSAQCPQMRYGG
jgi:hypothetical protein